MTHEGWGGGYDAEAAMKEFLDKEAQAKVEGRQGDDEVELCECGLPIDECDALNGPQDGEFIDLTNEAGIGGFIQDVLEDAMQNAYDEAAAEFNAERRLDLIQQLTETANILANVTAGLLLMTQQQFGRDG